MEELFTAVVFLKCIHIISYQAKQNIELCTDLEG